MNRADEEIFQTGFEKSSSLLLDLEDILRPCSGGQGFKCSRSDEDGGSNCLFCFNGAIHPTLCTPVTSSRGKQPQGRRLTHKCAGIRPFGNGEAAAFLVGAQVKHLVSVTLVFMIAWTAAAKIGSLRIKLNYLHSRTNTLPLTVEMT